MSFYTQARRLMNLRFYFILVVVVLGALVATFGDDVSQRLVRPCPDPPQYRADVPQEVRERIDLLHALGLLYCSDPVEGLKDMSDRIYWGSDGVDSILFFQPADASAVGVTRYGFGTSALGDAYVPGAPGASRPGGFRENTIGRPVLSSQSPEGSSYYFRVQGPPDDTDSVVSVSLVGLAETPQGFGDRDVFRDLEILWAKLRRKAEQEVSSTTVRTPIAIVPQRWQQVRRRWVNPDLAPSSEDSGFRALVDAHPNEPTPYQVLGGPLATVVWAAGVVTGTTPAMSLVVGDGTNLESIATSQWTSNMTDLVLAHFTFEPLEAGTPFEARYWHESARQDEAPPDFVWPLAVP